MKMTRNLLLLSSALGAAVLNFAPAAAQDDAAENEDVIVVTGSLIRRNASDYQLTSPVDVIGREELDTKAPLNIAEFVRDLPYNFGSAFASGRAFGNERGAGTINLRGLGPSATLVLVNGRRQTQLPDAEDTIVDVNSLVPEIMLDRMEILKDGASATYGSDAIAGVVNFITNDDFEGFKISTRGNRFTYSDADDFRVEALWGADLGGATHVVAAMGFYDQDPINGYAFTVPGQDPSSAYGTRFSSASSAPGEFAIPTRDASGAVSGLMTNVVDPECGNVVSTIPTIGTTEVADAAAARDCRYNFWADNGSQSKIRRYNAMFRATSDITDSIKFDGEFAYSHVRTATAYTAGETIGEPIIIPGHNPGNIYFQAMDGDGNPLYAESSGVSAGFDRDGQEVFIPLRDASGAVVLTADPTNPASGIPFYEDIVYSGRLVNSQGNLPTNNSFGPGEYAWSRPSKARNNIFRMAGGLSGPLVNDNWNWRTGVAYSRYQLNTNGVVGNGLRNELEYALQGLGGANCDRFGATTPRGVDGCLYFNPFGNSVFATPGDANANTQEVLDYVFPLFNDEYASSLLTGDVILSGDLFELPAGPVSIAAGYQHRRQTLTVDYDISANTNNRTNGQGGQDFDEARSTNAFFAEALIPVFSSGAGDMELTAAVRHERIGGTGETTDPKIGLRYSTPDGLLTLRGSYGTSFIAPSLFRLYAENARGTAVNDCPVSAGPPCTGAQNVRALLIQGGNPDLEPETSKSYSAGFTLNPLDGLTVDGTWWKFDFTNAIASLSATDVLNMFGPYGSPTNPIVRASDDSILSITTSFINQASLETEGFDFGADYKTALGDIGDLNLNFAGTYMYKYERQATPGGPIVAGEGETNDRRTGLSPNTKLRMNMRATWSYMNHRLSASMRYYGGLDFTLDPDVRIDSYTPVNLDYVYRLDVLGTETEIGVGAVNVFGEKSPVVPFPGFQPFIPSLHDTRGRSVYLKASVTF